MPTLKSLTWIFTLLMLVMFVSSACDPSPRAKDVPVISGTPGSTETGAITTTAATTSGGLTHYLTSRTSVPFTGTIEGTIPPQMSSFRFNPSAALGILLELKIVENATDSSCASTNPKDYELTRLAISGARAECEPVVLEPNLKLVEKVVKGGTTAEISYLVGSAGLNADVAFEFVVNAIAAAHYEGNSTCVDIAKVINITPSPRSCDIRFVAGATVTQITFRQYGAIEAEGKYNAVVNVEGTAYGSSEDMQTTLILSVDDPSVSNLYARSPQGFLIEPDEARKDATIEALAGRNIEEVFMLSGPIIDTTSAILPELSIENLLDDPEFSIEAIENQVVE